MIKRINERTLVGYGLLPDVSATLGAKHSRSYDIEKKWNALAPEGDDTWTPDHLPRAVSTFIAENLGEYNHSSIAEMAPIWIAVNGMGWPGSWLLLDTPLFVGQEVSTRVVKLGNLGVCDYAPVETYDLHDEWMKFHDSLSLESGKGTYKRDQTRFALPGTTKTGVVYAGMQARAVSRHIQQLMGMGGWLEGLTLDFVEGMKVAAPNIAAAVNIDNPRNDPNSVRRIRMQVLNLLEEDKLQDKDNHVELGMVSKGLMEKISRHAEHRSKRRTYLDPAYEFGPRVHVRQYLSVGAARDEHRHRAMMPWRLTIPVSEDTGEIMVSPQCPFEVPSSLWSETSKVFMSLMSNATSEAEMWGALHALPFCTLVQMNATCSLNALLYKAELRAFAEGAHWEYAELNLRTLKALSKMLPEVAKVELFDYA